MATSEVDDCNHVRVVVRVRPENQKEKEGNFSRVVQVVDNHILVFDPKVEEVSFFHGKTVAKRDITKRKNKDLKFVFDGVYGEHSSQQEVYEDTTKIVLDGVLNGYNCTVLAYGATGAGKTHTMLGSADHPGVMYLTMMDLYRRIDSVKDEKICNVAVSYLEVYNEQIRDLLSQSGSLAVREDAQKGVVVQGLTLHQPKSAEELLKMLDFGNKNRTQHPTDMNATSSRSHAVFQIYLRQQDKTASINQNVRIAKMCLIDLAGSERASATNAKGARLREGTNINRSLLALGNVINALADPKSKKQHIPYRNSKLTRLLKDSLGGNCRTIMIAAVSPSSFSYDDTYNTLKYANRAKDIKSTVKSNVVSLDSHISQYVKICEQQKKEIAILKDKLKTYEDKKAPVPGQTSQNLLLHSSQEQAEMKRCRETLRCLFTSRQEIRAEFLNLEMRLKENELKTFYHQQCHEQIHMLCSHEKAVKATCKRDHRLAVLKSQNTHMRNKREDELKRFGENTNWLHRVENEMRLLVLQTVELKENVPLNPLEDIVPRKKTRRKLMESPLPTEKLDVSQLPKNNQLNDSISNELAPIIYTPEGCNKTMAIIKQVARIPCLEDRSEANTTFDIQDKMGLSVNFTTTFEQTDMNSTVILSQASSEIQSDSYSVDAKEAQPCTSMLQRTGLPFLPNQNPGKLLSEKPSYMAMTSAAERKRKLLSSAVHGTQKEDNIPVPNAKRIRQDISFDCKALRVRRVAGSLKNTGKDKGAQRCLPRSISEGSLVFGAKKKNPFSFLGSTQSFRQGSMKK
ncbi:hypothetical protein FKM82_003302 [Ascaphus truei]